MAEPAEHVYMARAIAVRVASLASSTEWSLRIKPVYINALAHKVLLRGNNIHANKEDTPGRASLERPRTREPTTMP